MSAARKVASPAKTTAAKRTTAEGERSPAKRATAAKKVPAAKLASRPKGMQGTRGSRVAPGAVVRDEQPRQLTDPRVIRALAHPVRIALLDALLRDGPLTATEAAELLADSPGNMSWHLQTLAKYGYVEEAEGGVGRRRPWRLVAMGHSYEDNPEDPELTVAATVLTELGYERVFERLRQWLSDRGGYSPEWQHSWFAADGLNYLLPDELEQLGSEIRTLLERYRDRTAHPDRRPAGSEPVRLVAFGHPIRRTPAGN
jgi:DNA-binding transcriptional ArsR family regulator